jgi:TetR/AcrR family transcriptional regulator
MSAAALPDAHPHHRLPADERRRQLIEVSIDLFSRKGFAGTTTKEIAAAAGVTEAIIFRHFATKQDLYTAIVEHMCSRAETADWLRGAESLMERNEDEALFRYLMKGILDFTQADRRYERLILFAALEGNELALMHHNATSSVGQALVGYIGRRQREGAMVLADPHLVISALVGAVKFYAARKYLFGCGEQGGDQQTQDHRAIDDLVRIVLNGIRRDQTGEGSK